MFGANGGRVGTASHLLLLLQEGSITEVPMHCGIVSAHDCSLQADFTGVKVNPSDKKEILAAVRQCLSLRELHLPLRPSEEMGLLMETHLEKVNGLTRQKWNFGKLPEVAFSATACPQAANYDMLSVHPP